MSLSTAGDQRIADWNAYSRSFQSVMPSQMVELNRSAAARLDGHVVDLGCGASKILPFVRDNASVQSYTGVDASADMLERARWLARCFPGQPTRFVHQRIEETKLQGIDCAVSINSHYIWPDPEATLKHIAARLDPGKRFVLATINQSLDMPALLRSAEKECIAHPYWEEFKQHNLAIASNRDINLMSLNALIQQVQRCGFEVTEAHQRFYEGGLSFIVMNRS